MLVRTLDEITDTESDIKTPNWRSKRIVLAKEGVGFSVHETTIYAGTVNDFWYANHIEAVFITSGEGELEDAAAVTLVPSGATVHHRPMKPWPSQASHAPAS